jgi:hypothetical protein
MVFELARHGARRSLLLTASEALALRPLAETTGPRLVVLSRDPAVRPDERPENPKTGLIDAGVRSMRSSVSCRWTPARS